MLAIRRGSVPLARRIAWAVAARLVLLTTLFAAIIIVNVRSEPTFTSYSVRVGAWALAIAFSLSGAYAWFLRQGKYLRSLVSIQLVMDQVLWTVLVYLSGGVTSGATSFYGVSCFFGAILAGFRGAALAAVSAGACYSALSAGLLLGWLPAPTDQPAEAYRTTVEEALYSGGLNVLVLVIVTLLAGNLTERLRSAGGEVLRAQARASQAEREAELGRLAAGLAHEIRNPLGSIAGSVRLLSSNSLLSGEDRQLCDIIYRESQRLAGLVDDMLNLAKPRRAELAVVDLVGVAQEVVDLSASSGRSAADVAVRYQGVNHCDSIADGALFKQMLWNLVRNAVQASHAGSEVVVKLNREDEEIVICVEDHGEGLTAEAKERLFDPFFTTRSMGTGIGLAVVRRIVDEHGWSVRVEDTEGGGASFFINLGKPVRKEETQGTGWTLFPKTGS